MAIALLGVSVKQCRGYCLLSDQRWVSHCECTMVQADRQRDYGSLFLENTGEYIPVHTVAWIKDDCHLTASRESPMSRARCTYDSISPRRFKMLSTRLIPTH